MPGAGNATQTGKGFLEDYIMPNICYATVYVVLFLEVIGLTRFYYTQQDWRNSWECYAVTAYFVLSDVAIFRSLYLTKTLDPGYMLPAKNASENSNLI